VFELVKTGSSFAEKVLHSFSGDTTDGGNPFAGLISDATGDLFGTTAYGGAYGDGTAFELLKTGSGYTEKVLHSFSGGTTDGAYPEAGLIADAEGDLFGTTVYGGTNDDGKVFELVKTGSGYTEKVLHSFSGGTTNGANPEAGLIADATGDLFGTTYYGGAYGERYGGYGTVFELEKTGSGFAKKVLLLHSFSSGTTDGAYPGAGLIADAEGDLFGTTAYGGAHGGGMVFELVKTGSGFAEKVLHSFSDGAYPEAGLIADAKGDLFGTTAYGGAYGDGTAFELLKTGSGYTEKVLHSFTNADTAA
jgi:uncharacterized repeat protein (TIGR03803 family)